MEVQSFVQLQSQIITDKNISPLELRLYLYLLDVGRKGRGYSMCGHKWLGNIIGCHPQTIAKSLKNLCRFGYISVERIGFTENDKIRCLKTVKPQSKSECKNSNMNQRKHITPSIIDRKKNKEIEHRSPASDVDKLEKRPSQTSNTPQKRIDPQRTISVQERLQTHIQRRSYDLWFSSLEVVESEENITEMRLNTGEIGYDHIKNHYMEKLEEIIGGEVKITM